MQAAPSYVHQLSDFLNNFAYFRSSHFGSSPKPQCLITCSVREGVLPELPLCIQERWSFSDSSSVGHARASLAEMEVDGASAAASGAPAPQLMAAPEQSSTHLEIDRVTTMVTAQQEEFRVKSAQMNTWRGSSTRWTLPLAGPRWRRSRLKGLPVANFGSASSAGGECVFCFFLGPASAGGQLSRPEFRGLGRGGFRRKGVDVS